MSLFDFAKDLGKKLFGSDDEDPAAKIQGSIEGDNPGIKDLNIELEEETVKISGQAESMEAVEKAVLMAGNVRGVSAVNVDNMSLAIKEPADVQYYTVASGDSLSKIAKQFYGNAMDYPKLFDANKEVIKDPDLIYPGQKIRVPPKTW